MGRGFAEAIVFPAASEVRLPRLNVLKNANLLVRFLLELSAVAAAAYWGFATTSGLTQWLLGIGAPAAVIAAWWLFVSPKPTIELPRSARFAIELAIFGAAAVALVAVDQGILGVLLAAIELVSGSLNYVWSST
jgi:Protein of unknown function (DUF2568)